MLATLLVLFQFLFGFLCYCRRPPGGLERPFGKSRLRWRTLEWSLIVEPQLELYGVWNFEDSTLLVNNAFFTPDDFTGRLEGGLQVYLPKGWSVRGAAAYDGIGADYGKVWLNMPLN